EGMVARVRGGQRMTVPLWPNQERCLANLRPIIDAGEPGPICVSGPTGCGKSRIMVELIHYANEHKWPSVLYTNRTMLLEQLADVLGNQNISHGVRAAKWIETPDRLVQISSLPTEN